MATRKPKLKPQNRTIKTDYPKALQVDEYWAKYSCTNCGWSGSIKFKKGVIAPAMNVCPTCLCFNAKKDLPYVREKLGPAPAQRDPVPAIPVPGPAVPYPWPRVAPPAIDPWNVPHQPYRPWDTPTRPYFEQRQTDEVDIDVDHCTGMGFSQ